MIALEYEPVANETCLGDSDGADYENSVAGVPSTEWTSILQKSFLQPETCSIALEYEPMANETRRRISDRTEYELSVGWRPWYKMDNCPRRSQQCFVRPETCGLTKERGSKTDDTCHRD